MAEFSDEKRRGYISKYLASKVDEIKKMINEGYGLKQIAQKLGVNYYTLKKWVRVNRQKYGIKQMLQSDLSKYLESKIDEIKRMLEEGYRPKQIAKKLGVNYGGFSKWLSENREKYGIGYLVKAGLHEYLLENVDKIKRMIDEGYTLKEIAQKLGVNQNTFRSWVAIHRYEFNIPRFHKFVVPNRPRTLSKYLASKADEIKKMLDEGYTPRQIARKLGVDHYYLVGWISRNRKTFGFKRIISSKDEKEIKEELKKKSKKDLEEII